MSSNENVDWAKLYDVYETEHRSVYKVNAVGQNLSHLLMFKKRLPRKMLDGTKTFAEIGFGAGVTLRYMAQLFNEVIGLDISPKNVELTNKEIENEKIKNVKCDVLDIMKKNENYKNRFDVISFIHGIEHFSENDFDTFFENIKFYLQPNGYFTGALPNNLDFVERVCPHCLEKFEIDGHLSRHTKESLSQLFEKYNLKICYLDDINIRYLLKNKGLLKSIYTVAIRYLNGYSKAGQLEFIVQNN